MNREIPGMFYDPEKKKYFKITKNHTASAGAYSQDKVRGIKRKQQEAEKLQKTARRMAKEMVQKSSFYRHPLIDAGREIGTRVLSGTSWKEKQAEVFASELHQSKVHQFLPWRKEFHLRHVLRTNEGHLIAGGTHGKNSSLSIAYPNVENDEWNYPHRKEKLIWKYDDHRITSVSLSPNGELLTTLDPNDQYESAAIDMRSIPDIDDPRHVNAHRAQFRIVLPTAPGLGSIWSSAACPINDKTVFAIGAETQLGILTAGNGSWHMEFSMGCGVISDTKDILSVDWMDPNVVAYGTRRSIVVFRDLREEDDADNNMLRLRHGHGVPAQIVRRVDDHRLLVAGNNVMNMYDMRFVPFREKGEKNQAYLSFPEYVPTPMPSVTLSEEFGLLANSSDDGKVQLFSLQTGKQVKSPLSKFQYGSDVTCVSFDYHEGSARDGYNFSGSQTPSLLVCSDEYVDQWSW